jgi:hypothetical protein
MFCIVPSEPEPRAGLASNHIDIVSTADRRVLLLIHRALLSQKNLNCSRNYLVAKLLQVRILLHTISKLPLSLSVKKTEEIESHFGTSFAPF